jgi:uncharacterized protein YdeI (YjbR/CyaY-like superfamily)
MQPAGLREVERARADGRWDAAYDAQRVAEGPDDLRRALDADRGGGRLTRARRIQKFVAMLDEGKKLYP